MLTQQKFKNYLKNTFTNKLVLICLALSFVYFISGYFFNLEFIVCAIAITCFIILPIQPAFCIFFFLHNFLYSAIEWYIGFVVTYVCFTVILCVKYIIGVKNKKFSLNIKVLICFAIAFLLSMLSSINHEIYIGAVLYVVYLPLLYVMFEIRDELNITQMMNYMLFGFILSNCLSLFGSILPNYGYSCMLSGRYQAFSVNPNYLGMRAAFISIFYFAITIKNKKSILPFVFIYLFSLAVILATQSKTSLVLMALFTIIFIIIYLKKDFKKNIKYVLIFLLIAIILCFVFYKFTIQLINRFIPDKTNLLHSLLTGRDEIWLMYWNDCVKNPITILFGNGLISQEAFIPSQNITRTSHSLYLFLFYRFGIIGCIALGLGFYFIIKKLSKNKASFISSLPLLWFLLESLVDNTFLCFNLTFLPLALLFMFSKNAQVNNNNDTISNISENKKDG